MAFTAINNTTLRRQQYIDALRYYTKTLKSPIVFCENTLANISYEEISPSASPQHLELLFFDGNNYDKSLGKGYGECEIISYAIQNSRFISQADYLVKITGRLIITDISRLIDFHTHLPKGTIQTLLPTKEKWIDSRLIISPPSFFVDFFLPRKGQLNDSTHYYFEHLLYNTALYQNHYPFIPFVSFPSYHGFSGSIGTRYPEYGKKALLYYKVDASIFNCKYNKYFYIPPLPFLTLLKLAAIYLYARIYLLFFKATKQ